MPRSSCFLPRRFRCPALILSLALTLCGVTRADLLQKVHNALSLSDPDHRFQLQLSGLIDLETYFIDQPAPALLLTDDDFLLSPRLTDRLRLGLQPYLSLLELNYEVDEFLLAVKKSESAVLRSEASNTFEAMPHSSGGEKRPRLPKRKRIYLAVHRHDNDLYYKRLDPEGFVILEALRGGASVEDACLRGLSSTKRTGVDWSGEIKAYFNNWASLGWFCRFSK